MASITTIPSTAPFLDGLVEAILSGDLPKKGGPAPSPEALAKYTLLLPTRRACRVCGEAFLRLSGKKAVLLPTIRPLGDGNEDENFIHEAISTSGSRGEPLTMNPVVSKLERHLILTHFILVYLQQTPQAGRISSKDQPKSTLDGGPATASLMAHELAKLIDNAETEAVDLAKLEELVPEAFSGHWQQTLDFLKIITAEWPAYLENTEQMDIVNRRNRLLEMEAERLSENPPAGPIIIAGSTGSIPAAAKLMAAVMKLENGAIVLPGLDQSLEDSAFNALKDNHPEHPQFGLSRLLNDLDIERRDVSVLEGTQPDRHGAALIRFLNEALRPASSAEKWQDYINRLKENPTEKADLEGAFENISYSEARDDQEEAEMISLILRRTAATPGRRAALVTPDRLLARRVATRLEAWDIRVDDSGGRPLTKTLPGAFFNLLIETFAKDYEPTSLLALLKHPLARLDFEKGDIRLAARALEIAALRRPWRGGGLGGISEILKESQKAIEGEETVNPALKRLSEEEWFLAETLLERLIKAATSLNDLKNSSSPIPLERFIRAHIDVAENLAVDHEGNAEKLWQGAAGEHLAKMLTEILTIKDIAPKLTAIDYPDFYKSLLAGETVRPLTPVHPRLFIWGPFEARLQQPDVIILAGLNEGTWPAAAKLSPWLSRPMCRDLGLPSPEQQTGYGAHDFQSLFCAAEVHLTRAAKTAGVQTVKSRWLQRIEALLDGLDMAQAIKPGNHEDFAAWAGRRNQFMAAPVMQAPAPKPPVSSRPRQLSVTRIEDWIANPYSIFARHILRLTPLDPLGSPPSPAIKGQMVHEVLEKFTRKYPKDLPPHMEEELNNLALQEMQAWSLHPEVAAFWLPRFTRFAAWFASSEPARRKHVSKIWTELQGTMVLEGKAGPFRLTARADRIDAYEAGTYHIYDYKTGVAPKLSQIKAHLKPQLPLEAAILQNGGFKELKKGPVTTVSYIEASGAEPAGRITSLDQGLEALIAETEAALLGLVNSFDHQETPYKAMRRKAFRDGYRYDDYAHLARLDEWGVDGGEESQQ